MACYNVRASGIQAETGIDDKLLSPWPVWVEAHLKMRIAMARVVVILF